MHGAETLVRDGLRVLDRRALRRHGDGDAWIAPDGGDAQALAAGGEPEAAVAEHVAHHHADRPALLVGPHEHALVLLAQQPLLGSVLERVHGDVFVREAFGDVSLHLLRCVSDHDQLTVTAAPRADAEDRSRLLGRRGSGRTPAMATTRSTSSALDGAPRSW